MKKLLLSTLSVLTCLALTAPVFAQGSVTDEVIGGVMDGCNEESCSITISNTFKDFPSYDDAKVSVDEIVDNKYSNYGVLQLFEATLTTGSIGSNGLTVTFKVPNLPTNANVIVLHYVNKEWIREANVDVKNGTVIVSGLKSFSPFAILVEEAVDSSSSQVSKEVGGWDDGGPFTTDECGNVFDRWGNEIYHAPSCVVNGGSGTGYNFVNTADR